MCWCNYGGSNAKQYFIIIYERLNKFPSSIIIINTDFYAYSYFYRNDLKDRIQAKICLKYYKIYYIFNILYIFVYHVRFMNFYIISLNFPSTCKNPQSNYKRLKKWLLATKKNFRWLIKLLTAVETLNLLNRTIF